MAEIGRAARLLLPGLASSRFGAFPVELFGSQKSSPPRTGDARGSIRAKAKVRRAISRASDHRGVLLFALRKPAEVYANSLETRARAAASRGAGLGGFDPHGCDYLRSGLRHTRQTPDVWKESKPAYG